MRSRILAIVAAAVLAVPAPAVAQQQGTVLARVERLAESGETVVARRLVDSLLARITFQSPLHADAIYWRARLAPTAAQGENDYRRLVVEHPFSSRAADALIELAGREGARGERAQAIMHLQRFLRENPTDARRGRAGVDLTRLLFDINDLPRACASLLRTRSELPATAVELLNQLEFFERRCRGVDTTAVADPPTRLETPPAAEPDTAKPAAARGNFTLQVAALSSKAEADRLATRLRGRGIEARVVGTSRPFRVRIGRYATRAAAQRAAADLKAKGVTASVTAVGAEER